MDRHEDNRQFSAFNSKQEMQPDGDATDHDGEFEEPRGQSRRREKEGTSSKEDHLLCRGFNRVSHSWWNSV